MIIINMREEDMVEWLVGNRTSMFRKPCSAASGRREGEGKGIGGREVGEGVGVRGGVGEGYE